MAKNKVSLSGAKYVTYGYGVVEPNHLSAPRNGQVYGQLPADKDIEKLENGQFVSYNYAKGLVTLPEEGAPVMMVFNEVKVYEDRETDADFAMLKQNYVARVYSAYPGDNMPEGTNMVPRVLVMSKGDIYTTNCVNEEDLAVGDELQSGADGYLSKSGSIGPKFAVVKVYTMPDNQKGVKLQCIAE